MTVELSESLGSVTIEVNTASTPKYSLLLAHGAGAGLSHVFMDKLAVAISSFSGNVIRFNFPYMEQGRKSPGSPKPNIASIGEMVKFISTEFKALPIFLSGKSYGGRMSSHWVSESPDSDVKGLVYFGFPLHAPGRDSMDRAAHLYNIVIPQLFIQGTKDKLANYDLISQVVSQCQKASIHTIEHGDHSFKVPKKLTGKSGDDVINEIAGVTDQFILKNL